MYTFVLLQLHNGLAFLLRVINDIIFYIICRMDPGPVDDSHLYLQATHRSQSIWDTSSIVVLSCRRREAASQRTIPFDQRIAPYLEAAGFLGVS